MKVLAENLSPGDVIEYHGHTVTVISEMQDSPNQFGLPWFKFKVENEGGWGWARFGPTGTVERLSEGNDSLLEEETKK